MRIKSAGAVPACVLAAAFLSFAPPALAAPAPAMPVPCDTPAVATAIADAASGETLHLARSCHYVLTAALPVIGQNLTIDGDGATLERSTGPGTPASASSWRPPAIWPSTS
jgi:hypothetical protein